MNRQTTSRPLVMDVITRMNVGGPARHVAVLSEGLETRGYRTMLVTGVCEEAQGDLPAAMHAGRTVVTLPALSRSISPLRDLAALWNAYRLMRRERPAIVHTHTAKAGMIGRLAARAAGVPVVLHTFHGNSLSSYFSKNASRLFCRMERLLARLTDRICVVSCQQLEELGGRFRVAPRAKFVVMPLGIDLAGELELPLPHANSGVMNVGWLGRLVPVKGVPLLVATIAEAAKRNLPIRFLIGGDGPDRELIRQAVERYGPGRVVWTGWQHDVTAFLSECDALLQTSANEGTPLALIQGMAAGRPFVSTAAGGVVDLVSGAPSLDQPGCRWYANAVLAEPDPIAFVNALERLRSAPACLSEMAAAARQFAAERFQAPRLLADMDRLYRELLILKSAAPAPGRSLAGSSKVKGESGCRS